MRACARCERLYAPEALTRVEEGWGVGLVDRRPRGVAGGRVGCDPPERVRFRRVLSVCAGCGGVAESAPPVPLWKAARSAWATAVAAQPELARFAPRSRRS